MVVNLPNELYVNITMRLPGNLIDRGDIKVQEHIRNAKAKEIRKVIESINFQPDQDKEKQT